MKTIRGLSCCILGIVLMLSLLSGCQSSQQNTSEPSAAQSATGYKQEIVFAPRLDFISMDVQNNVSNLTKSVYFLVYNTLVELDVETQEISPALAESWNQVSDTVWEFKLRENVLFHNGSAFTSEDVKFTYEMGLENSASKSRLDSVLGVNVVDEYTVQVNLNQVDMDFLYKLTDPALSILSHEAYDTMPEEDAVQIGTGPYQYEQWLQGEYVSVVVNSAYWGEVSKTERIVVRSIPEAASRLIALQTGEVDVIQDPNPTDLNYIAEDAKLKLEQYASSTIRYIDMNVASAPFDNPLVRQAVAYGTNRNEFIDAVYLGGAVSVRNVMHPDNPYYHDVEGYSYDPEKARELLSEAGYPDGFSATIITTQSANDVSICTLFQAQMTQIGIDIDIQMMETAAFNKAIAPGGTYQLMVSGYSGYTYGPDSALRTIFHTGGRLNYANVDDAYINEALDLAVTMSDTAQRQEVYRELQEYMTNLAAFYPIAVEMTSMGMNKDVAGMGLPNGAVLDLRTIYIPA